MTDTPDAIREAVHAWIRYDAPVSARMTLGPTDVTALVSRLSHAFEAGDAAIKRVVELQARVNDGDAYVRKHREAVEELDRQEERAERAEADLADARAEIERKDAALRFYACDHPNPNEGPWGTNSTDFGDVARAALAPKENADE
jgi:hypothetical protein